MDSEKRIFSESSDGTPKNAIKSITLWINVLSLFGVSFVAPLKKWISKNPEETAFVYSVVHTLLRFRTNRGVRVTPIKPKT